MKIKIDKKSKIKFAAGTLGIAGILSMASPVLAVPFVVGVLLNNRNRRELYKYQTLEQVYYMILDLLMY